MELEGAQSLEKHALKIVSIVNEMDRNKRGRIRASSPRSKIGTKKKKNMQRRRSLPKKK